MDGLVKKISESCGKDSPIRAASIPDFTAWEEVKPRIYARLINTEKNLPLLKKIPSREYLDLSLVYYVHLETPFHKEYAVVQISNEHMRCWKVNEDTLFQSAWANIIHSNEAAVENIADILKPFFHENQIPGIDAKEDIQMYILSNRHRVNGAVQMCNKKALREAAGILEDDFWILPSSVHEVILIPVCQAEDCAEGLAGIVREINDTQLEPQDILSYRVYHYSRKTGEVTIAA